MAASLTNYSDPDTVPVELCEGTRNLQYQSTPANKNEHNGQLEHLDKPVLVVKEYSPRTPSEIAGVLRAPLYRIAQIVAVSESSGALICITYVLVVYKKMFSVHSNIALLLYLLHILCLIHAINYIISKIYQLYISLFAINPCHMFLPRNFYLFTHNLIVFCTSGLFNTLVAMVTERCVATALVDIYEKRFRTLGILLTVMALLVSLVETGNGYKYVAGDYLMTNSLIHPGTKSTMVDTGFAVLWLISCLLLLTTILLYCFNTRRKKRLSTLKSGSTLTSRYQSLENIATSGLLCVILAIYLVIFSTYTFSMMFLRLTKSKDPMLDAYKEVAYLIPLGTLLIPLGALIFMKKSKQRRRYGINDIVNIQTHGLKGWDNYAAMLNKQWNM